MAKRIERQGSATVPYTEYYPKIYGGICEFCGVIDNSRPSIEQYKLCPHYSGIGEIICSYCDQAKNPAEVMYKSIINVHGSPDHPDELVVVCNNFKCSQRHEKRFKVSN